VTRLFVTVWPPPHAVAHVRAIDRTGWDDVRWVPEANWHVTLRFLGERDESATAAALASAVLPAAVAGVGSQLEILDRTSLVVPVDGLADLAAAVAGATAGTGDAGPASRFYGHLTVGRSRGNRRIVRRAHDRRTSAATACEFPVEEVALVMSELSSQGACYTTLARFTTRAGGAR
jgi:2'-5' RNA ligase